MRYLYPIPLTAADAAASPTRGEAKKEKAHTAASPLRGEAIHKNNILKDDGYKS